MRISDFLKTVALVIATALGSCSSGKVDYESAILEWTGKEIVFPDSMPLVGGGWYVNEPADFTIVSYYDSVGCTGCRMKLPLWNEFMAELDSIRGNSIIRLVLITALGDEEELSYIRIRDKFEHFIAVDAYNSFNAINRFPNDLSLNTFLLDNENRVISIGNPVANELTWNLYHSLIGKKYGEMSSQEKEFIHTYDFGNVRCGETVCHIFNFYNETSDTLRIKKIQSSCECTEGKISSKIIPPGYPYNIEVSFHDTISGEFVRSVVINFENNKSRPLYLELSGVIK